MAVGGRERRKSVNEPATFFFFFYEKKPVNNPVNDADARVIGFVRPTGHDDDGRVPPSL